MIKSNKNMLKMLVALAFIMSPVFAVAACNPSSTKDDQAKLKTGDLNKLKIIAPEIEAFNNVKDKTGVTKNEITTVVNTIVKTAIDQIITKTNLDVDYRINIQKDLKIITGTYDLTSKTALDRTFDITVIRTQTGKLKGTHKSQSIVFPELKEPEEVVVTKADLSKLEAIDSAITVEATESTNTSADKIVDAVKKEVLKLVNELANGENVEAADLEITVKKDDVKLTGDSIDLKDGLTLKVEVKASKIGEAKLEGTKNINVKIAKITPVVVKADLSKLEAIDSAITVEATESTNTSADKIVDAVKKEVLKLVNELANGENIEAADLEITVKKDDVKLTGDSIDLKDGLTLKVEVKASKIGEAKLEGTKNINVKIAKITPVVVKADLSKLEAIDSAITVEATESTNTSADKIVDAVKKEVLKLVNELANGENIEAADLEITVKKDDVKLTGDSIDLKDGLTLKVEVKASKIGEAKLEGTKNINVKIAQLI